MLTSTKPISVETGLLLLTEKRNSRAADI